MAIKNYNWISPYRYWARVCTQVCYCSPWWCVECIYWLHFYSSTSQPDTRTPSCLLLSPCTHTRWRTSAFHPLLSMQNNVFSETPPTCLCIIHPDTSQHNCDRDNLVIWCCPIILSTLSNSPKAPELSKFLSFHVDCIMYINGSLDIWGTGAPHQYGVSWYVFIESILNLVLNFLL